MLSIIGHWIYSEIFGWGGIGAIVAALAWVLWFFTPALLVTYKSQLLHIAIAATVFTVAQSYFFTTGYSAGEAECKGRWDAANVKAANDAAKRDQDIASDAAARVQAATNELQQQTDALQRQVDDYVKQLSTRKGGDCPLTADDIDRLSNIK